MRSVKQSIRETVQSQRDKYSQMSEKLRAEKVLKPVDKSQSKSQHSKKPRKKSERRKVSETRQIKEAEEMTIEESQLVKDRLMKNNYKEENSALLATPVEPKKSQKSKKI